MSFLQTVINSGVNEETPRYLRNKIVLSNQISLFVAIVVAIPFFIISQLYFPPMVVIPIIGFVVAIVSILLNRAKLTLLARLMISVLPVYLGTFYGAGLNMVDEMPFAHTWMIMMSFSLIPVLVFDMREKAMVFIGAIINIIPFLFYQKISALYELEGIDNLMFREGPLVYMTIFSAYLVGYMGVSVLSSQISRLENETSNLLVDMDNKNKELIDSENVLKNKLSELELAKVEEDKRSWSTKGIAEFSNLLRSDVDFKTLCDKVISKLVQYVSGNQGGLYTIETEYDEKFISLQSSYAYGRKKYSEKRIEIGQGLLGQAYLEKSNLYLKEIPEGYITITSGLGDATPNYLLVAPMVINGQVEGIFELASFSEFEPHVISFVKELGEAMAGTLSSKKLSERTTNLLEETRQQTEEMRAQEEEMRQNMEELQATQEEMHRKEQEYVDRIQLLESKLGTQL